MSNPLTIRQLTNDLAMLRQQGKEPYRMTFDSKQHQFFGRQLGFSEVKGTTGSLAGIPFEVVESNPGCITYFSTD